MPYEVIKNTKDTDVEGVQMGDKYKHKFYNNAFRLPDSEAKQARDIKQKFGQEGSMDVLVAEVPSHRAGNKHFISRVPWHEEE